MAWKRLPPSSPRFVPAIFFNWNTDKAKDLMKSGYRAGLFLISLILKEEDNLSTKENPM